jgi:2-polyprenyl-3-methyl-5-hydroxy-6-metoxy-1,4-benzoquinol methylase
MSEPADAQRWDARDYAENARFVADLGLPVLDLLAPQAGERILDVGCGDGALTAKIAHCGVSVVGIDSSPEFIAAASAVGLDATGAAKPSCGAWRCCRMGEHEHESLRTVKKVDPPSRRERFDAVQTLHRNAYPY